jgi:hypothetical protein
MIMEASTSTTTPESKTQQVLHEADTYVRENPVPAVLCALGVGFALGLLIRALDRPTRAELLELKANEARGFLANLLEPVARESSRAYARSAKAVHGAADRVRDIDVEDYTDPVVSWFSRMWKKCCG